jgi:ethanolamine ammonia-lyase small subunit
MAAERDELLGPADLLEEGWSEIVRKIRARTPARLLAGRAGSGYRTRTQMELRQAHAAARDAVRAELNLEVDFGSDFMNRWNLFEVCTLATNKDEYLLRPDLGRQFDDESRVRIAKFCSRGNDLQIAIGDGLSVTAISSQARPLLEPLCEGARARGWSVGQTFVVRHCRVGVLNEIGELLAPQVAVLLIGERPGLATAESLSAYMAYRPRKAHSDADRNLISNIHPRGVSQAEAVERILNLTAKMMATSTSGCLLRENLPARPEFPASLQT